MIDNYDFNQSILMVLIVLNSKHHDGGDVDNLGKALNQEGVEPA